MNPEITVIRNNLFSFLCDISIHQNKPRKLNFQGDDTHIFFDASVLYHKNNLYQAWERQKRVNVHIFYPIFIC